MQYLPVFTGNGFGGSSNIYTGIYNGGHPDDYIDLGCFDDILKYQQKSEKANLTDGPIDAAFHRFDGLLPQAHVPISDIGQAVINCGMEQGYAEIDSAGNFGEGFYKAKTNTENGRRSSHADAFLEPVKWRKNLHKIGGGYVFKILFDSELTAIGVQYIKNEQIYTALARQEVILTMNAYDVAQLLMLSGKFDTKKCTNLHYLPFFKVLVHAST